jgi:hypothetical protein
VRRRLSCDPLSVLRVGLAVDRELQLRSLGLELYCGSRQEVVDKVNLPNLL